MSNTKISDFPDGSPAQATDELVVARGGANVKLTTQDVADLVTPAGSSGQLQYNDGSAFAGMAGTAWDNTTRSLTITGATVTASAPVLDLSQTWNDAAVGFTGLRLNVTNTASAAGSRVFELLVAGESRFDIDAIGSVDARGPFTAREGLIVANGFKTVTGFFANFSTTNTINGYGFIGGLNATAAADLKLERDAADTLAQRRGTNAQTSRLYFSFTDASNFTRLALKTATGIHTLETESAGTGEANIDLALTPKGTGRVRFGTHSAIAAETVTGYIEIKDEGGTVRKVAIVS
jgi:hypothetical protein